MTTSKGSGSGKPGRFPPLRERAVVRKRLVRLSDASFYLLAAVAEPFELVIKSAIVIESELEAIFEEKFSTPRHLYDLGLTYEQKVLLVLALGLDDRLKPPLIALSNLRNKFAHNLEVTFGIDQAKSFYSAFSKSDKKIVRENYESLSRSPKIAFDDLAASELFALCVTTLRAAIIAAKIAAQNQYVNGPRNNNIGTI